MKKIGSQENHVKYLRKKYHLDKISQLFIDAPNVECAAAIMLRQKFTRGKGEAGMTIKKLIGYKEKPRVKKEQKPKQKKQGGAMAGRNRRGGRNCQLRRTREEIEVQKKIKG